MAALLARLPRADAARPRPLGSGGRVRWADSARSSQRTGAARDGVHHPRTGRARRGDPDADAPLTEEHALAQPTEELARIAAVAAARGEAAWLAGDGRAVASATDAALSLALERARPGC